MGSTAFMLSGSGVFIPLWWLFAFESTYLRTKVLVTEHPKGCATLCLQPELINRSLLKVRTSLLFISMHYKSKEIAKCNLFDLKLAFNYQNS